MREITLAAPAKINPYLHIVGKRADGYHLLDTAFQLIDLQDTVRLRVRRDASIVLHTPIAGLLDAQHLAVRAAVLLQTHTNAPFGADIWVDKHIPSGAGLGGGSSDAATALMGLNALWGCSLNTVQLQALGLQLGADVPFFCSGLGAAQAGGVGDELTPQTAYLQHFVLIFPDCHVPTPAVFHHPDLTWSEKCAIISGLGDLQDLLDARNDLQPVAQALAPQITRALTALQATAAVLVRMSGSGSSVFAAYRSECAAKAAKIQVRQTAPAGWQIWQVGALKTHPAQQVLLDSQLHR